MGNALRAVFTQLYGPPRPIPLRVETQYEAICDGDGMGIYVFAEKDGAFGAGITHLSESIAMATNKNAYLQLIDRILRDCTDRALAAWLMDHETQQGWPPRECIHDGDPS